MTDEYRGPDRRAERRFLGIELGVWLQSAIGIAFAFIAYYVGNEVAPIKKWQDDVDLWRREINERAESCKIGMETSKIIHEQMHNQLNELKLVIKSLSNESQNNTEHNHFRSQIEGIKSDIRELRQENKRAKTP